jgi:hypothetical protein
MTTLADCLNLPVGSDERLKALEAWRREEDARLAANPPPVKIPSGNRPVGRPPSVPAVISETLPVPIDPAQARREWERRKEASDAQREADQAVAIRARLKKAAALTAHRLNALSDIATKKEKLRRLAELEASLSAHKDPKTLIAISNGFVEIEQRLLRLTAE